MLNLKVRIVGMQKWNMDERFLFVEVDTVVVAEVELVVDVVAV